MKVFAVIPAYNEEKTIGRVVQATRQFVDGVIVVDDHSSDKSFEIAKQHATYALRHKVNRGQGAALRTGTNFALKLGADVIVHFDADEQQNPAEIKRMVEPIANQSADVALGSRFLSNTSNTPFARKMFLKAAIYFTWFTSGVKLTDAHNGFRALSRKAAETINIRQDRMAHASEIIEEIGSKKLRWVEVPVTVTYTDYSMQKGEGSVLRMVTVIKDLLKATLFR